jgi:hypothetical protein
MYDWRERERERERGEKYQVVVVLSFVISTNDNGSWYSVAYALYLMSWYRYEYCGRGTMD